MTKVSIILPVYNSEKYLRNTLNCILTQTLEDFELICVNDGSTDGSLEILNEFSNIDSRIKVISQKNSGPGSARNAGLNESDGEYIFFMDSDDYIAPDFLKLTYDNMTSNDSDIAFFKIGSLIDDKKTNSATYFEFDKIFPRVEFNNFTFNYKSVKMYVLNAYFAPWTKLYKNDFLKSYDDFVFDEDLPFEDILFHVKSMLRSSRISFVPEYLYYYRLDNEDSVSYDSTLHDSIFKVVDRVKDFLVSENYYDRFKNEYELFRIAQIIRHIPQNPDEEYYKKAKSYLDGINSDKNPLVSKHIKRRWDAFSNASNPYVYEINREIPLLHERHSELKQEKQKLKKQKKKYIRQLENQKNIQKEIYSTRIWKLIKIAKTIRALFSNNSADLEINVNEEELTENLNEYKKIYPPKECPICGHVGIDFRPYPQIVHREVECPNCLSHERHRALWLYFRQNNHILKNGNRVLHFAPEEQFRKLFSECDIEYHPVDVSDEKWHIEEIVDVQDIPYEDNYFDLIYCSHVLEHVPDDKKALSELYRVLKPGGTALILVPINGIAFELPHNYEKTLEDAKYNTPELREKHYGQFDHVRLYGTDFKDRLMESGFDIKSDDFIKNLGHETVERYALIKDENIFECTK
ncbi:MAG: glycosyltransferase [Methanobrevibacter thaueri]|uniref:Glycosyltransferase n=1 Tax=Methanobrevibacter thaueri TaxID=190975 RepID=A0A8T3V3E1_9EURY|nr:glycosyltransferase [Methanobrevibacter thaueri]MBE6501052.1 glycosyltransferase [Methanobrevibacter thaueri]